MFFFFKQKTAYEMRISDWSSDVCSSDLPGARWHRGRPVAHRQRGLAAQPAVPGVAQPTLAGATRYRGHALANGRRREHARRRDGSQPDRKSVVSGKSVSVRVDLGGRRIINKQTHTQK